MAEVYEARQVGVGRGGPVAIKVLHRRLLGDGEVAARFRREARSAAMLTHPNSLMVLEAEQDADGLPYLVMELLRGRDLARVLREDFPLPLGRVIHIVSQVLDAIGEAHARRIVHRDLKPSNIMLVERNGSQDFVKVCDYGIAKLVETDGHPLDPHTFGTASGQTVLCGTPEYMSPEQARGETLDGRSDLYAIGIILYQMVTGGVPFRAKSPLGVLTRHITESARPPSQCATPFSIPPALDTLIMRALGKDREQRPATAAEFRAALRQIGSDASDVTPLRTPALRAEGPAAAPTIRRRPAPLRLVAGTGALLLVGGAALAVAHTRSATAPVAAPAPKAGLDVGRRAAAVALVASAPPLQLGEAAAPAGGAPLGVRRPARRRARVEATAVPLPTTATLPLAKPLPVAPPASVDEMIAAGEQLLAEGHVGEACARLESAKAQYPVSPALYRFLGKCYMRSRRAADAKTNYRRYLELKPEASDATFIKGILD